MKYRLALIIFFTCAVIFARAEWRAGIGRVTTTPENDPIWLAGYAARTTPATGVWHQVWAKALVLEDGSGKRAVIITADTLGFTRALIAEITEKLHAQYGVTREQLYFNASHTHSAPMLWGSLPVCNRAQPDEALHLIGQTYWFAERVVEAVGLAMADLGPAKLSYGRGTASFAINRRQREVAPVDHDVPVLRIAAPDGRIRAIICNYACHCTTVGFLVIHGDYAGAAMLELEKEYPGATAFFIQGCAGDQGPEPRGTLAYVQKYGSQLAQSVRAVLSGEMKPVREASMRMAMHETTLEFAPVPLESFRKEMLGEHIFKRKRAQLMVAAFNAGHPIDSIPYPVQALRLGDGPTLLFLSGEIVVDYALRTKEVYANQEVWVAGYSSEVQGYIPTVRILREGGYEADSNLIYYAQPGPFKESVEEVVWRAITRTMTKVGES